MAKGGVGGGGEGDTEEVGGVGERGGGKGRACNKGWRHVWFRIDGHTIIQKCFCTCETMKGRRYGFCRDFYGRKHALPDKIFEKLYPNGYTPPTFSTPQNMCIPCPVEKKSDPVETSTLLQLFINKHMV